MTVFLPCPSPAKLPKKNPIVSGCGPLAWAILSKYNSQNLLSDYTHPLITGLILTVFARLPVQHRVTYHTPFNLSTPCNPVLRHFHRKMTQNTAFTVERAVGLPRAF